MSKNLPIILIDTREQDPWTFARWPCRRRSVGLVTGDYSVGGMNATLRVERKSVFDLFGSMTSSRARFLKQLERLGRFPSAFLVVEGPWELVARGLRWTSVDGARVLDSVYRLCAGYGVVPMFCRGRLEAEEVAWRLMKGHWEARSKNILQ